MINIFEQEKLDGLEDKIKTNLSISYTSDFSSTNNILPTFAKAEFNDFDLYYIESILASVGWNLNDDVFDKQEILKARNSSIHKKFNFMHDESDIIGHIISSKIIDEDGKECADLSTVPDKFDILNGSVIYKIWEDEKRQSRINKIIAEIQEGKWCVSMECLFSDFDYAVITPTGEHKVIARNKDSSFLTKYLKAYGGNGVYNNNKVGRLLKNFVFSGKGLVDNPGNPRSVILSTSNFKGNIADLDLLKENIMSDVNELEVLKQQVKELTSRAEAAEKTSKEANEKEINSLKETIKNLTSELATSNQKVTNLQENAKALNTANEELKTAKVEVESKLKEVLDKALAAEAASKKQNRLSAFANKSIDEAKAKELVDKFENVDDESFDILLSSFADKNSKELVKADLNNGVITDKNLISKDSSNDENEVLSKAKAWLKDSFVTGKREKK